MPPARTVIQVGSGRVHALVGRVAGSGVRVIRVASQEIGNHKTGLADALRALGLPRAPVVLAVPRADTVFKPFAVPDELADTGEWLGMATLQLTRQLQMDEADAMIDAVLVRAPVGSHAVAGAVAKRSIEHAREACRDAGLKLVGAVMCASGTGVFGGERTAVVVAPGAHATEIVLAHAGVPIFARSISATAGIGDPDLNEQDRVSAQTAVEVKRTLIGARAAGLTADVEHVVVLGADALADGIASACELELGLRTGAGAIEIDWPADVSEIQRREFTPLAGTIWRRATPTDAIDFLAPHRPPDTGAKRRQVALLALLAVVTLVGGAILAGSMRLAALERDLERAKSSANEAVQQLIEFKERDARVGHAEQWVAAGQDWLPPVSTIADSVNGTPGVALADLRADARVRVSFERGPTIYPGTWTRETQATVRISGAAQDAAGTRALRRAFLDGGAFHVLTQGPDAGDAFVFDLVTTRREEDGGQQ